MAGYKATALTTNTFVRNSDISTEFKSIRPYTFLINAPRNDKQG
ncbi:MAG: hypothetical protein WCP92_05490 [bacterium]